MLVKGMSRLGSRTFPTAMALLISLNLHHMNEFVPITSPIGAPFRNPLVIHLNYVELDLRDRDETPEAMSKIRQSMGVFLRIMRELMPRSLVLPSPLMEKLDPSQMTKEKREYKRD
jgi:hypothetical protein